MLKSIDQKLDVLAQKKQNLKTQQQEKELQVNNRDQESGILIRKGTRVMTEDELRVNAQGRVFVPIGNMDHYDVR